MNEALNSPYAVAAILALVIIIIDKMIMIIKTVNGSGMPGHLERTFERMTQTIEKLNDKIDQNNRLVERLSERIK